MRNERIYQVELLISFFRDWRSAWIASPANVIVTYSISLLAFLFRHELHPFRLLSSLRSFSKLYESGGSVVSALAISSSPALFDAFFLLVLVADPAAASVAEISSSVLVADPAAAAAVAEFFPSVLVADPAAAAAVAEFFPSVLVADPAAAVSVAEISPSVFVADPAAAASVVAAFAPLPVVFLAVFVPLAAIFVSVPVSVLVPAVLVSADQVPLAVSYSSHYPS
jgi:hypothetical protein